MPPRHTERGLPSKAERYLSSTRAASQRYSVSAKRGSLGRCCRQPSHSNHRAAPPITEYAGDDGLSKAEVIGGFLLSVPPPYQYSL